MTPLLPLATAISIALIALLWRGDPKRRRTAGLPGPGQTTARRRALSALAVLPGIVLAALGDAAAFLVWFGACAIAGWLVAQMWFRA
jgi:hypothetical protein